MLSKGTKERLANLIIAIAINEKQLEVKRQLMFKHSQFSIFSSFNYLSAPGKENITVLSIKKFFNDLRINVEIDDIENFVIHNVKNIDPIIVYNDYVWLISPKDSPACNLASNYDLYPLRHPLIEKGKELLADFFQAAIDGDKNLDPYRSALLSCSDFDISNVHKEIDVNNTGHISTKDISRFLEEAIPDLSNIYEPSKYFIRAFDTNKDNQILLYDFKHHLLPESFYKSYIPDKNFSYKNQIQEDIQIRNKNEYNDINQYAYNYRDKYPYNDKVNVAYNDKDKYYYEKDNVAYDDRDKYPYNNKDNAAYNDRYDEKNKNYCNDKDEYFYHDEYENKRIFEKYNEDYKTPIKKLNPKDLSEVTPPTNVGYTNQKEELSSENKYNNIPNIEDRPDVTISDIMKEQIESEQQLENRKKELVDQNDFNLMEGFRIFDTKAQGSITMNEFHKGFKALKGNASIKYLNMLFKRMGNRSNDVKYKDYYNVIIPKTKEYEKILNERPPYTKEDTKEMAYETKELYKNVLECLVTQEWLSSKKGAELSKNKNYNIEDAYKELDLYEKGYVSRIVVLYK